MRKSERQKVRKEVGSGNAEVGKKAEGEKVRRLKEANNESSSGGLSASNKE